MARTSEIGVPAVSAARCTASPSDADACRALAADDAA